MYVIGLCGRSGSGKSTVCEILLKKGVYFINADRVCRDVYATNPDCVKELCVAFGDDVADKDGKVIRPLLAERAFATEETIQTLNGITQKYIINAISKELVTATGKYVVLDAPLLFEARLNEWCDAVIAVVADEKQMLDRLVKRDGLEVSALKKRHKFQLSNRFLAENSTAVILNNGTIEQLRRNTFKAMFAVALKLHEIERYANGEERARRYVLKKH